MDVKQDRMRRNAASKVATIKPRTVSQQVPKRTSRSNNQFRQIFMKTGIVDQAAGSAYIECGNTKVMCAIYGPRQTSGTEFSETGIINCEFKYTTFAVADTRKKYIQDQEEKEFSQLMLNALEVSVMKDKFPKAAIDIYALVLESDGGELGTAINAASLALASAGIEMFDLVASCTCSINAEEHKVLLDATRAEQEKQSQVLLAYMSSLNQITQLFYFGDCSHSLLQEAVEIGLDGCAQIYLMMKQALTAKFETFNN